MKARQFDALTKVLGARRSRRDAVGGAAAGLAALVAGRAAAQEATPVAAGTPTDSALGEDGAFLFVQTAMSGSFRLNPGAGTPAAGGSPVVGGGAPYLLTLEGHHGETIYFSDRPQRIVGEAPTTDFLTGLGFMPDNPPNAAIVAQTEEGDDIAVLELTTPAYDEATGTLTYGATILADYADDGLNHLADQRTGGELPEEFGRASLFIDDCPDLESCYVSDGSTVYRSVGSIPGGSLGTCWSWTNVACLPCDGESFFNIAQRCNDSYGACNGECIVWAPGLSS